MSRFVLEIIKEQILDKDTPDYVLMNKEDVVFLLDVISCAENMEKILQHSKYNRHVKKVLEEWGELLHHEV